MFIYLCIVSKKFIIEIGGHGQKKVFLLLLSRVTERRHFSAFLISQFMIIIITSHSRRGYQEVKWEKHIPVAVTCPCSSKGGRLAAWGGIVEMETWKQSKCVYDIFQFFYSLVAIVKSHWGNHRRRRRSLLLLLLSDVEEPRGQEQQQSATAQ